MNRRILIVDDDAIVGESLKVALGTAGYAATLVLDGLECARQLKQQPCDLLILDLNLPTLDGWDILDLVTGEFPALPVIVMTGLLNDCEPGSLVGADVVLEKPPDVRFLFQLIEALLSETAPERLQRRQGRVPTVPAGLWASAAPHKTTSTSPCASK